MGRVTVVGSYIVAQVIDVERIPIEGETLTGRNYHVTHGGKGSNMACCAARLGAHASFLGRIGRDAAGAGFIALLAAEGVDASHVLYSDTLPTAVGMIVAAREGGNVIVIDPAANREFSPQDVCAARRLIAESGAIVSPLEIPLETALAAASLACTAGIPAILNPAPAQDLRGFDLGAVAVLTPNENEARVCLGLPADDTTPCVELGRALLALGPANVVITLGSEGALWFHQDGMCHLPALEVAVVDTVGAGDAFNAGLATGLSEGQSMADSLVLGITAASLSTRRRETIDSYVRRDEVDARAGEVRGRLSRSYCQ